MNKGVGGNVKDEMILWIDSFLVFVNMCDVLEVDEELFVFDLKEDEEDKSVGIVIFRLYWNYFK